MNIKSLNPHNKSYEVETITHPPCCRWGNWGIERLNNLSKVPLLVWSRVRIQIQAVWLPSHPSFSLWPTGGTKQFYPRWTEENTTWCQLLQDGDLVLSSHVLRPSALRPAEVLVGKRKIKGGRGLVFILRLSNKRNLHLDIPCIHVFSYQKVVFRS